MIIEASMTLLGYLSVDTDVLFQAYLQQKYYCLAHNTDFCTFMRMRPDCRKKHFLRLYQQGYDWKALDDIAGEAKRIGYWK